MIVLWLPWAVLLLWLGWPLLARPVVRAVDDFDRRRLVAFHRELEREYADATLELLEATCDEIEAVVGAEALSEIADLELAWSLPCRDPGSFS